MGIHFKGKMREYGRGASRSWSKQRRGKKVTKRSRGSSKGNRSGLSLSTIEIGHPLLSQSE
jgi:hypothetical protein